MYRSDGPSPRSGSEGPPFGRICSPETSHLYSASKFPGVGLGTFMAQGRGREGSCPLRNRETARYARLAATAAGVLALVVAGVYLERARREARARRDAPPMIPATV